MVGVPVRFGRTDRGVALDLGDPLLSERFEVTVFVTNVLDLEDIDFHADAGQVRADFSDDGPGKGLTIAVQLFDGHGGDGAAQGAAEDFVDLHLAGRFRRR